MSIGTKKVAVLVPVYKSHINELECVSLTQLIRILGDYPLFYVAPDSLEFNYVNDDKKFEIVRFADDFFQNVYTYSQLMLSEVFYESFLEYEYILIYQLDAFVFSNELEKFCNLGYDYIGAPLQRFHNDWKEIRCNIGNGGFSLRKVSSCLNVVKKKKAIFEKRPVVWGENRFLGAEDVFFSFCSTIKDLNFSVPSFFTALDFAVGTDIAHVYKKMPNWMPFGCHAWTRVDYWAWKPLIERYGYNLPQLDGIPSQSSRKWDIYEYILRRCCRSSQIKKLKSYLEMLFSAPAYDIWGNGSYGRICLQYLHKLEKKITRIYDITITHDFKKDGIWYSYPEKELIFSNTIPLIVAIRNESAIASENILNEVGAIRPVIFMNQKFCLLAKEYMKLLKLSF